MSMSTSSVTAREAEQVAAANASGRQPVVFIHGLWLLHSSWDAWRDLFEEKGYATVAVDWPDDRRRTPKRTPIPRCSRRSRSVRWPTTSRRWFAG